MVKPVMNLDEVEFDDVEENGIYTSSRATIGDHIGARNLGYNLTILPPGKVQCPFHCHHGEEEIPSSWRVRASSASAKSAFRSAGTTSSPAHPAARRWLTRSSTPARRRCAISRCRRWSRSKHVNTLNSGKVLIVTGKRGSRPLRKMFRAENTVDYYDREDN